MSWEGGALGHSEQGRAEERGWVQGVRAHGELKTERAQG